MTSPDKPRNANKRPYHKEAFDAYVFWASLPPLLRGRDDATIDRLGFDPDDPDTGHLFKIKTHKQFAEHYGIKDLGTLTDWRKRVREENLIKHSWLANIMVPNVIWRAYEAALNPRPEYHNDRKLVLKFAGWEEPKASSKPVKQKYIVKDGVHYTPEEYLRKIFTEHRTSEKRAEDKRVREIMERNEEESRRLAENSKGKEEVI